MVLRVSVSGASAHQLVVPQVVPAVLLLAVTVALLATTGASRLPVVAVVAVSRPTTPLPTSVVEVVKTTTSELTRVVLPDLLVVVPAVTEIRPSSPVSAVAVADHTLPATVVTVELLAPMVLVAVEVELLETALLQAPAALVVTEF